MFAKNSRYYRTDNVIKPDVHGRNHESKALRIIPAVAGQFLHIVEDSDRLDNLAYKYYRKPKQWWRICDANPEFFSPRSLLGKEPIKSTRFDVQWDGLQPPWYALRDGLLEQVGVESALLGNSEQPYPDETLIDVGLMFSLAAGLQTEITDSIPLQQLTLALDTALQAEGLVISGAVHIAQISATRWQLQDIDNPALFALRLEAGVINVYEQSLRFSWSITLRYNEINITTDELLALIESIAGFQALSPTQLGRVGKPIVVPPGSGG